MQLRTLLLIPLLLPAIKGLSQQVKIEFYTPNIVHVVKTPTDSPVETSSLVVTAQPEDVEVTRRAHDVSSRTLTVRLDPKTQSLTFLTPQGKVLLREKDFHFEQRTTGSDTGAYRVTQRFVLDKDETIYGLGTIQNGRMNRRDTHKLMEQSNLEDF